MAKDSDHSAGALDADNTGGLLSGLLAEENEFDRSSLWRIGSWGVAAIGAVIVAVMANQSSLGWRREQLAAADLARHAQQIQSLARESQNETRRLSSAIDTLNNDRDRLYSRITVLEQGLDSVTGTIARQNGAASATAAAPPEAQPSPSPQNQAPPTPAVAPVATTSPAPTAEKPREATKPAANVAAAPAVAAERPRTEAAKSLPNVAMAVPLPAPAAAPATAPVPLGPAKSMMGPPDPAAPKMIEAPKPASAMAAAPPDTAQAAKEQAAEADAPKTAVQRTEFAVDLGSASSIGGLRALWRGILKSNAELAALHPIIVVKESTTGLGMQLRLAAGPLQDAAAAAKICAALLESERGCETTVFDGQRLAMAADDSQPASRSKGTPAIKPVPTTNYRHGHSKRAKTDDTPPKTESSTLSSWFSGSKR